MNRLNRWRPALRIARRDARRAKGRSLLVIAMIALPVLGVGASDVLYRTFQLSDEQRATREIGAADARLAVVAADPITQDARGGWMSTGDTAPAGDDPAAVIARAFPGARLLPQGYGDLTVAVGDRRVRVSTQTLDWTDPIAEGLYTLDLGRAAASADEVVVTTALAERLGLNLADLAAHGQTVTTASGDLEVVGAVTGAARSDEQTMLISADSPLAGAAATPAGFLAALPDPLDWEQVQAGNALGILATGRGPVPGAPVLPYDDSSGSATVVTAVTLVVGMVLLEIVLLAGPAFAVGAKRQRRDLALLSATGGGAGDVRRVVLGGGVVLGAVGGIVGVTLGIGLAAAVTPVFTRLNKEYPGPFELRPLELLAIAGIGLLTAVLAAALPARSAAKEDPIAGLTGRRGITAGGRVLPLVGLAAALAGGALAYQGALSRNVNVILAGSITAELGLVATTPFLVGLAGRLAPRLPLAPRLALRDAARHRSRTAPAVAAILAAVAGSVAVGTFVASQDATDRARYTAQAPENSVVVQLPNDLGPLTERAPATITGVLPEADVALVRALGYGDGGYAQGVPVVVLPEAARCPMEVLSDPTPEQYAAARTDPRCEYEEGRSGFLPSENLVGDAATLATVSARSPETDAALAAGGMVVPARLLGADGTVTVRLDRYDEVTGTEVRGPEIVLPAAAVPEGATPTTLYSTAAAARLGVTPTLVGMLATADRPVTAEEEDLIAGALGRITSDAYVYVERGYVSEYGIGLLALVVGSGVIVLGASSIATGLAAADGRADLGTLAAVGATPSLRRRLAAFQSAVTAVLGTLLGVVAGLVPALGLIRAINDGREVQLMPYVIPWPSLAVTVVGVPLLAALAAALLTRSRLPLDRRMA